MRWSRLRRLDERDESRSRLSDLVRRLPQAAEWSPRGLGARYGLDAAVTLVGRAARDSDNCCMTQNAEHRLLISARVPQRISDELAELAAREQRSVSGQLRIALAEHLARHRQTDQVASR